MEFRKNDFVEVTIEDIGNDGEGIGKVDGFTLFVKDAVPGDVVQARIVKNKKHYAYARLEKVISPSPFRTEPLCVLHRQCGGCQLQALTYEKQLEFKYARIRNNLIRIGCFDEKFLDSVMEPVIGMDNPFHYRNKAQYPVGTDKNGNIITGFYAGRTHNIIANTDCLLGPAVNEKILNIVLEYMKTYKITAYDEMSGKGLVRHVLIRSGFTSGQIMVCLVINKKMTRVSVKAKEENNNILVPGCVEADGNGELSANVEAVGNIEASSYVEAVDNIDVPVNVVTAGDVEVSSYVVTADNEDASSHVVTTDNEDVPVNVVTAGDVEASLYVKAARNKEMSGNEEVSKTEEMSGVKRISYQKEVIPGQDYLIRNLCKIEGMTSVSVSFNTDKTNVIMGKEVLCLWGIPYIEDTIHVRDMHRDGYPFTGEELTFHISPLSFYQVNPVQTEKLYSLALEYADLTGKETVWDLYCGIGTISLFLARKAGSVYGVEVVEQAMLDARQNACRNGIENARFYTGRAEEVLPAMYREQGISADVIVVDPPRKGCDSACLETMLNMSPHRIVYISCDSATLARDLKVLCEGGYEIRRVRGIDVFGMTTHCEVCVELCRKYRLLEETPPEVTL